MLADEPEASHLILFAVLGENQINGRGGNVERLDHGQGVRICGNCHERAFNEFLLQISLRWQEEWMIVLSSGI